VAIGYLRSFCFTLSIVLFADLFALLSIGMFMFWYTALIEVAGIVVFAAWAFRRWNRHHRAEKYDDRNWRPKEEPSRWR